MSPLPTPEYAQHLDDLARRRRRGVNHEDQTPDRSLYARSTPGVRLPADPRLLENWRSWFARAHIAWARRHAPHLLKEWLDD